MSQMTKSYGNFIKNEGKFSQKASKNKMIIRRVQEKKNKPKSPWQL